MLRANGSGASRVGGTEECDAGNSQSCRQMHRSRVVRDEQVELVEYRSQTGQVQRARARCADQRLVAAKKTVVRTIGSAAIERMM